MRESIIAGKRIVAGLVLAALCVSGCGRAPGPPPEVATLPSTVILFAPSMTEAACAMGYADRIVGITDYDRWPPEILDRPRIGGALDPDLERIAVLDPDLLILQGRSETLHNFAVRTGIRVEDVKMDDELDSIFEGMLSLDDLLGGASSTRGEELTAALRAELDSLAARRAVDDPGDAVEVLFVLSRNPHELGGIFTAGSGTFLDELLRICGARNWVASPGYFEVPLDEISARPPQLVLESGSGITGSLQEREQIWSRLPGDPSPVQVVEFDGLMIPGPRIVRSARSIADALDRAAVR